MKLTDEEVKKLKEYASLDLQDATTEKNKAFFRGVLRVVETVEALRQQLEQYNQDRIAMQQLWGEECEECIKLQQEIEQLQAECNAWKQSAEIAEKLALDAQAQVARMREALRKVQWVDNYTGRGRHCKCCAGNPDKGHSDYCKVGQALAAIDKIGGQDDV